MKKTSRRVYGALTAHPPLFHSFRQEQNQKVGGGIHRPDDKEQEEEVKSDQSKSLSAANFHTFHHQSSILSSAACSSHCFLLPPQESSSFCSFHSPSRLFPIVSHIVLFLTQLKSSFDAIDRTTQVMCCTLVKDVNYKVVVSKDVYEEMFKQV